MSQPHQTMYQFPDLCCGRLYQNPTEVQHSSNLAELNNGFNQLGASENDYFPSPDEPMPKIGWNS